VANSLGCAAYDGLGVHAAEANDIIGYESVSPTYEFERTLAFADAARAEEQDTCAQNLDEGTVGLDFHRRASSDSTRIAR
jgi:hypothetical protein